jgi:FKBP-type peptidyl-prolyl cis-trans isomerase 2
MAWFSREALKHLGSIRWFNGKRKTGRGTAGAGRWFEYLEERTLFSLTAPTEVDVAKTVAVGTTSVAFAASDFTASFTDTNVDANNNPAVLANITLTSLPADGTLTLSGVAVTANQTIASSNIANLTYMTTGTFNGVDSFGWLGTDNVGEQATTAANVSVSVLPVVGTVGIAPAVIENQSANLTAAEFQKGFNDGANGTTLQAIEITSFPSHGTLTLNSGGNVSNITLDTPISLANIPNLTYTPLSGYSGEDTFNWDGSIDGTTFAANGGTAALGVISPAPSVSAVSIPVFENQATTLTAANFEAGFTDALSDATSEGIANVTLENVQILTLPTSGTLALNGTAITGPETISVSDIGNVTYTPNSGFAGSDTFTWTTSIVLNNTTYAAASNATVTLAGTVPTLTSATETGVLNHPLTIPSTDFSGNFTDTVNGGTLTGIEIVTLPVDGTLTLGNATLTAGATLPAGSLGNITYTPNAGFIGSDSFEWNATDFTGNLSASNAFLATPSTVSLNIAAPVSVSSISESEALHGTSVTFSTADFVAGFTDLENGTLQSITITSLPTNGALTLGGAAVTVNETIPAANIGTLVYTQNAGFAGNDSFGWNASDGITSGLTAATVNLTVPADTAPTVTTVIARTTENAPVTFTAAEFTASFTDTDSGDALQAIKITSLPLHGSLALSGTAVVVNQVISAANIANLTYTPTTGYSGADLFAWNGSDGFLFAGATADVAISVGSPTVADFTRTVTPGSKESLTAADFDGAFSNTFAGDTLTSVKIESLPTHGTLTLGGAAVTVNQVISISAGTVLTYTPKAGFTGADAFKFLGGDAFAFGATAASVNLIVATVPTLTPITVFVKEGTETPLTLADFTNGFSDANPHSKLETIQITSLPSNGNLTLNGVAVTAGETIASGSISGLAYTPFQGDSSGDSPFVGTDSFQWNGSDGLVSAAAAGTVNLSVNALPTLTAVTIPPALAGVPTVFTAAEFTGAFTDSNAGLSLETIEITSLPTHGTLHLAGAKVTKGEVISIGQVGTLTYTPAAKFLGGDSFGWNGSDGINFAATASTVMLASVTDFDLLGNGTPIVPGSKTPSASSLTDFGSWTILPDASVGTDTRTYTILNSSNATITLGNITLSDPADFTITSQPATLTLAAGATTTLTVAFHPTAVGKHVATLSIANSSGDLPLFSFAIQGTGVHTTTIATTASAAGGVVQEGTTKSGSGVGAANGEIMGVTYTGYLASGGTIFDSTVIEGGKPLVFRLDDDFADSQPYLNQDTEKNFLLVDQTLVAGFEYGLQGIKVGESRTLVINALAGYGADGNGGVPANAVLIFDVKCVSLVTKPQLAVDSTDSSGDPTRVITAGQKTISADDNTLFALSNGSSSSQTFDLLTYGTDSAAGAALSTWAFRGRAVVVSGDSKDFGVGLNSGVLTVTFHPVKAGTRTATIKILTTDPLHPTFEFEVQGVSTPTVDLIDGFSTLHLPKTTVTSGTSKTITLPLLIENIGNSAVPSGSKTNIQIYAEDSSGNKTLISLKNNVSLAGPGVDKIKHETLTLTLPATLASGAYTFVAEVNQSQTEAEDAADASLATLAEISTTNNTATTTTGVAVMQGTNALTGKIAASTLLHSASGVAGKLTISLENIGTLTLPKGQEATVEIVAHPAGSADTSSDVVLASGLAISLGSLGVHSSRSFVLPVNFAASIASGVYDLEATVTPTVALTGVATVSADANSSGNPVLLVV